MASFLGVRRFGSVEDLILEVIVMGGLPRGSVASPSSAPCPLECTGELADRAAREDDEEECEIDEADGLMAELASLPVGDAFRRKSDLNFII